MSHAGLPMPLPDLGMPLEQADTRCQFLPVSGHVLDGSTDLAQVVGRAVHVEMIDRIVDVSDGNSLLLQVEAEMSILIAKMEGFVETDLLEAGSVDQETHTDETRIGLQLSFCSLFFFYLNPILITQDTLAGGFLPLVTESSANNPLG